jgi:tetratricopeptide (TPR) repeat protein
MRVGPYEVASTLGQGGTGVVYAARSPEGRDVAVKVLRRSAHEGLARFERERRLLASFHEAQGFVPLLDAGTTPEGPYLVMPLVPGGTLRKRLGAGRLGIVETVELGRRLALALGEAHARGVVHRDMKPENVLFTAEGLPLIADLGLAKHFDHDAPGASQSVSLSRHGFFRGTAGYMAGEQMTDAQGVGPPADVFSLGAILYECLAGEPPFVAEGVLEVLARVGEGRFEPLRLRRPDVPAWLAAVVERALAPAAWDRFPDGLALGRALAGGAGAGPRRFRSGWLAGAGVVVLAGALGVAHAFRQRPAGKAVESGERLEQELHRAEERIAKSDWDGAIESLTRAIALDPRRGLSWMKRGYARARKNDLDGALADLDRAVAAEPKDAMALANRASVRRVRGDGAGAITDCTRAIEANPKYEPAWEERSLARGSTGDSEGAVADATRAIDLDPKDPKAWSARAAAKRAGGDPEGAIADYDHALALDPESTEAWVNRGAAKRSRGDLDGAIADATRAIALDPSLAIAWGNRSMARDDQGDLDGAIDDATRALTLDPKLPSAWGGRGSCRSKKGDQDGAIDDLTRAIELDPTHAALWGIRGNARSRKGDRDGALGDYERCVELAPGDPQAPRLRAEIERLKSLRDGR